MLKNILNIALLVILSVLFSACSNLIGPDDPAKAEKDGVLFKLKLDKTSYLPDETLKALVSITNNNRDTVTFSFGSSCQVGYIIKKSGNILRSFPRNCYQAFTFLTIPPGETKYHEIKTPLNSVPHINTPLTFESFLLSKNSPVLKEIFFIEP